MKILLLGKNGQVGYELQRALAPLGHVIALGRQELDLTDYRAIQQVVRSVKPQLIINAAAYTAVDQAEKEPDLAMAINGTAPGMLAEEARKVGAAIIHYSTDYVFNGQKKAPYTEEDTPNPLNVYGRTKLASEQAIMQADVPHLILRTSWVYGRRGKNFLLTILRLAREKEVLRVVNDQVGSPTWCRYIADSTAHILQMARPDIVGYVKQYQGLYHLSAAGETTWYQFALFLLNADPDRQEQVVKTVQPITSAEYPALAIRPNYSVLDNLKIRQTFGTPPVDWREGVVQCLAEKG